MRRAVRCLDTIKRHVETLETAMKVLENADSFRICNKEFKNRWLYEYFYRIYRNISVRGISVKIGGKNRDK